MRYTVAPSTGEKWQVVNIETGKPYGDPLDSLQEASSLAREAQAYADMDRMIACRAGSCSI